MTMGARAASPAARGDEPAVWPRAIADHGVVLSYDDHGKDGARRSRSR
jgi:hypothetical protein